jgi:cytochrome c peroxidase
MKSSARELGRAWRLFAFGTSFLVACGNASPADTEPRLVDAVAPNGLPAGPVTRTAPEGSELTEERAQLGRKLFYETELSRTGEVSCASCHRQEHAFSDPDTVSSGVEGREGTRNAPALVNLAWSERFFWDGRTTTLEEQAGQPIENPLEMDLPLEEAVDRLKRLPPYAQRFEEAYGGPIDAEKLTQAIASFVRVLVSGNSPYDRHLAGDDQDFGEAAARGERLFSSERAECFHCHPAGAFTNDGLFNNGSYVEGGDEGRRAVTGRAGDLGKFKVPSLRNVGVTGPYLHDGSLRTLREVVERYAAGGLGHPSTDPQIRTLELTKDEVDDLVAFLESLTDDAFLSDARFGPPQ